MVDTKISSTKLPPIKKPGFRYWVSLQCFCFKFRVQQTDDEEYSTMDNLLQQLRSEHYQNSRPSAPGILFLIWQRFNRNYFRFFYFRDIITLTFKYNALLIYWKYVCTLKKQMFISFLCVLEQLMKLYCRNSNFETCWKIQYSKRPEDNIRLDILFPLVHTDLVSGDSSPAGSAVRAVHQIFRGFGSIFSQILANQVQERIHKRRKQRRLE